MKKNKLKELTNKKGFMIALYSCAAIVITMTGIIASNNTDDSRLPKDEEKQAKVEQANQSDVKSYRENLITGSGALETESPSIIVKEDSQEKKKPEQTSETKTSAKKENEKNSNDNETSEKSSENDKQSKNEYVFFDDSKEMSWPLAGQIVMDYSMETAIYDKTLDQYRTNDSVCISGNVGDDITASAEGKVKSVSQDKENLTSVVIEHGNGWLSTYSQLQNNVLVKEGDIVDEGAVIGNLSEPSYKSSLLGPHLEFKVMHNDGCTDPKMVLSQEE